MKTLVLCVIVGIVVLPCMAAETLISTYNFGTEGKLWDTKKVGGSDNTSVSWSHVLEGLSSSTQVTHVTLTLTGSGIDNSAQRLLGDRRYEKTDNVSIMFMGQNLGKLEGNSTTFELSPALIGSSMDVNADLAFQKNNRKTKNGVVIRDLRDALLLKSATLTVTYETLTTPMAAFQAPVTNPVAVPVPGALLLAGVGTLLVGALRRRKSI